MISSLCNFYFAGAVMGQITQSGTACQNARRVKITYRLHNGLADPLYRLRPRPTVQHSHADGSRGLRVFALFWQISSMRCGFFKDDELINY
jgi:hypothetical protein